MPFEAAARGRRPDRERHAARWARRDLPLPAVGAATLVVDLLYRPPVTPLQAAVRDAGGVAFGGLGLLIHQAALSFEIWTGQPAPMEVMSARRDRRARPAPLNADPRPARMGRLRPGRLRASASDDASRRASYLWMTSLRWRSASWLTMADVLGCLILSRDGLVLGAFPRGTGAIKPGLAPVRRLGEPARASSSSPTSCGPSSTGARTPRSSWPSTARVPASCSTSWNRP